MYLRFIQLIIQSNIADLSKHTNRYISPVLTQKAFANMRRVGKGFSGVKTPLFETMLVVRDVDAEEEVQVHAQDDVVQEHVIEEITTEVVPPTPTSPLPSSPVILSIPPHQSPSLPQPQAAEGVELVVDQEKDAEVEGRHADTQAEIYNIDLDHSSKVLSMQEDTEVQEAVEVVTTAKLITKVVTAAATQQIDWNAAFDHVQAKETRYIKRYHGFKKKPQSEYEARKNMISYLKNTEGEEMEKEDEEIIKSINETPAQKVAKRRKLSEEAQEADDLRRCLEIVQDEDDDVFVEAIPLAQKFPIVDYQVAVIDNKPKFTLEQLVNVARLQVEEETFGVDAIEKIKEKQCVSAANEELTAAKHKLMLLI
nr:hypothetical protein [Tanacetum cinerariifolium]